MPLNLDDKKAIVADVNQAASTAISAVVADYRGLTVSEVTGLRKQARDAGVLRSLALLGRAPGVPGR